MKHGWLARVAAVCVLLAAAGSAWAAEGSVVEPRARKVMRVMGDLLKQTPRFTVRTESTREKVTEEGRKFQSERNGTIAVRRPDGMWAEATDDQGSFRVWYDGKRVTFYNVENDEYSTVKAPATIDETFDMLAAEYGIAPPLIDLVYADVYAVLDEFMNDGLYLGLHQVRGVRCHHLAFATENIDWQIWIEDGLLPLPRKVVITYKKEPAVPQFVAYLSDWNLAPQFPDSVFTFLKPEDARMVPLEKLKDERESGKKGE